jgi:hypothetical protein
MSMSPKTTAFISRSAAAQLLGVSARTIDRLVDIGFLIKYTVDQGEPRRYGAVRQAEVLILRLHWGEGVPLADAVRWFGVTKSLLLEFVNAGVLTPGQTADLNNINALAFSKEDLDSYYCRLTKGVRSPWKNRSSLTETTRALSRLGLKLLDVLKLVADGRLDVWAPTNSPSVAQLTFDPRDVAALLKGPDLGRRLIDSEQAVHRLGVDPQTLFKWRATGQISAVLSYDLEQYYDPHELDAFMADLIPSHEAAKMWGVEVGEVETWCWNLDWGIHSATGTSLDGRPLHLFRRRDVERLQATFSASDGLDSPEVLQSH